MKVLLNATRKEVRTQAVPGNTPGRAVFHQSFLGLNGSELEVSLLPRRPEPWTFLHRAGRKALGSLWRDRAVPHSVLRFMWTPPVASRDVRRFDILHTDLHFLRPVGGPLCKAVVWSSHGLMPEWFRYKSVSPERADEVLREVAKFFEWASKQAAIVVSATRAGLRGLQQYTRIPADRMAHARVPVALPPAAEREAGPDVRLLFVGRDPRRKGLSEVLEALRALREKGLNLRLDVVSGAREDRIPGVVFHGMLPHEQVLVLLRQSDIFVQPTKAETFYFPVVEAMAHAIPVVTSDIEPITEVVTSGEEGFLVVPGDVAGLTLALRRLVTDSSLRHRMGQAGRRRIEREFSPRAVLPQWLAIYRRALSVFGERSA